MTLVPGANQVRLNPTDVTNCKPVGNIHLHDSLDPRKEFRNEVVGFGGNAAIVTARTALNDLPIAGVAYQCP